MLKKSKITVSILLVLMLTLSLVGCGGGGDAEAGDYFSNFIITNANVYTVDEDETIAEAVVVEDEEIVYVGDDEGALEYEDGNSKVIDMDGGTVMPGIVDAHMHPLMSAVNYMYEIFLPAEDMSEESYLAQIQAFVDENPELDAYTGMGFMRSLFDEIGPRKEALDEISTEKPIMITSADGHSTWVNSKALELAGIDKDTKDPENGVIQKDPETGEPAGLLQESAGRLVSDLKPEYTKEQYKEAFLWLQEWLNERGWTTIWDAGVSFTNEDYYMAYQELAEEGKLTMRIRGGWSLPFKDADLSDTDAIRELVDEASALSNEFETPFFQVNSVKMKVDDVLEEETAYMAEPYSTRDDGWQGLKNWDDDELANMYTEIDAAGFQIHTHQVGDAAATYALDALEKAAKANGERDSRHSFAHAQFVTDADKDRMAELGMTAVVAPYWAVVDDYYYELSLPSVGEERIDDMYPVNGFVEKGINTAMHSDFPVTEPDLGWLLYSSVTRTLPDKIYQDWFGEEDPGRSTSYDEPLEDMFIGPLPKADERVSLEEAVKLSTYNGAYSYFMEDEIGSIEIGKYADLILFTDNIFELDIEDVSEITPMITIFNGEIVFSEE